MEQMELYAGLDMHQETTTGTIKDEQGNPFRILKVETNKEGVRKLFEGLQQKSIQAYFRHPTIGHIMYENVAGSKTPPFRATFSAC